MATMRPAIDRSYELQDRYLRYSGRVFISGIQALVRLPLVQRRLDRTMGRRTAGFISGYRGSPVAGYDQALVEAGELLRSHDILFQPGVNEALAATAVLGSQQVESEEGRRVDGVFGLWYGKGPGVDWAGDALKHGNAYGSSPNGGVLVVAGDDHGAVSSTTAHQSDQTLAAWYMPVLNPGGVADYLDLGLYGWALSRFSGAWVGFKAISETVESAATVELQDRLPIFLEPCDFTPPSGGLHFRWADPPSVAIEERLQAKLEAAEAFARVNAVDRLVVRQDDAWLGIVTVGKAHGDLMEALRALGFGDERSIATLGVRILKIGQSFPIEGQGLRRFARGLQTLLVIEEKRPFVEDQIKTLLYPLKGTERPPVLGKKGRDGRPLIPGAGELRAHKIAPVLARFLRERHPELDFSGSLQRLSRRDRSPPEARRTPYFCSGCPHNSSTVVPEGSKAMAGIGCHVMAAWMPGRSTAGITQMGGEGANWVGLAPFTSTPHMFQNLGDGTYYHSGQIAIRQAVAAGTRITYKILFNDAVAMTGGQKMETARLSVPQITRQVWDEGVRRIAVVTDEPAKYGSDTGFAPGVTVHHRRALDAVQRELRDYDGVSVLLYDQTCAAEKRRRRKRNEYPDPPQRAFINELVCEGCGDCSRTSNCLSVVPVDTDFGTKRQIDQSSCNKDFSCVEGFCPSFVSVEGGKLKKGSGISLEDPAVAAAFAGVTQPELPSLRRGFDILITGVGGTGVLTIGAILGVAAHLEGAQAAVLDFTGLAQKGGGVLSHVRLAAGADTVHAARIEPGEAEAVIACDLVVATSPDAIETVRHHRTRIVGNAHTLPTADFIHDPNFRIDTQRLRRRLVRAAGDGRVELVDAHRLAVAVTGDAIGGNMLLLGFAWQKGLVPLGFEAIDRAIELNGVAVQANKLAFAWGRLAAHDPAIVARFLGAEGNGGRLEDLDSLIAKRRGFLVAYQNETYAMRYEAFVREVSEVERQRVSGADLALSKVVARNLFKLMSYKDEYEVARLYSDGSFEARLAEAFEGDFKVKLHMAPPLLARRDPSTCRPRKAVFGAWMLRLMRPLARLKALRGTPIDPFGWTIERRMERALIDEYRATVESLLVRLDHDNHALAVQIASLAGRIRGFGHVKDEAVEVYRRELTDLMVDFERPPAKLPIAAE